MVKRELRIKKSIESLSKRIGEHFEKLEKDIEKGDEILTRYHIKELDKSLIASLEHKLDLLGEKDKGIVLKFRKRLETLKKKLSS